MVSKVIVTGRYRLRGRNPGNWQTLGEYKSGHAAICAMASRTEDFDQLQVVTPNGVCIAQYEATGGL